MGKTEWLILFGIAFACAFVLYCESDIEKAIWIARYAR